MEKPTKTALIQVCSTWVKSVDQKSKKKTHRQKTTQDKSGLSTAGVSDEVNWLMYGHATKVVVSKV